MNADRVALSDITIPPHRARALDTGAVTRMAESISALGLRTPITLRYDTDADEILLVAGLHRLEAARSLGWDTIPAIYTGDTADEARRWEIAENLHRSDLTELERAKHIAEWDALAAKGGENAHPSNQQPHDRGVSRTARELGIDRREVREARKIASMTPDAHAAAVQTGLSDNRTALLQAATEPPDRQADAIRTYRPAPRKSAPQAATATPHREIAREAAALLIAGADPEQLAGIGRWLSGGGDAGRQLGQALLRGLSQSAA